MFSRTNAPGGPRAWLSEAADYDESLTPARRNPMSLQLEDAAGHWRKRGKGKVIS